jgi:hypothetical protein
MLFSEKGLKSKHILILGFLIYFSVFVFNDGFMALDEYWVGILRYIPAQTSSVMTLVAPDDVKSPLQLLPMHTVAQLALSMGVADPYWQYRAVIFVLGLISTIVLGYSFYLFAEFSRLDDRKKSLLYLMMIFYFAGAFAITRPMFESIAAPWLALAAVYAFIYDHSGKIKPLLLGVLCGSLAFVLRQQLGFCALVFVILPLIKKDWKGFGQASALGAAFFLISGIPDYFLRGKFHYSLLNLTFYNFEHGAEYGKQSILFYPALIFVITLFPFFIAKYPQGFVKRQVLKYRSFYLIVALFVFLHSLFPNKWERFVISLVPVLVLIFYPFLDYLQLQFKKYKWRLISLYAINFFLFILASYFPAQENLIDMSLYLNKHPEIKKIHRINETPGWITEAFILNKNFKFVESNESLLQAEDWKDCGVAFVVGSAQAEAYKPFTEKLHLDAVFNVNLIEQWAFKLNPSKNPRRVQLKLYSGCEK